MRKKVSCHVITYNQKDYISQCIDGILMQKVSFPIEIIIGDDNSTDGTKEIVKSYAKKYPEIIRLNIREVRGSGIPGKENFLSTLKLCTGEYISLCDGDDYWTDPLKLQKQVDFLDANPNYSICWTKYSEKELNEKSNDLGQSDCFLHIDNSKDIHIDLHNIFTPYITLTLTCMFRANLFDIDFYSKLKYGKDNTLYTMCLTHGDGILLNDYTGVYRKHNSGIYSSASIFKQKYLSYLKIKEIIDVIPKCNNNNIVRIRKYLLIDSVIYLSRKEFIKYINLFQDSLQYFGLYKTIKIYLRKIKGDSITRQSFD
jgi:glycosyltransferase involved in cell wall biosynthesis